MLKKFISIIVILHIILLSASVSSFSYAGNALFTDVPSGCMHEDAIKWAYENKIIVGSNNKFGPEDQLTEAQFVVMLAKYGNIPYDEAYKGSHYADKFYKAIAGMNLPLQGYTDSAAKDKPIFRGRIAQIVASVYGLDYSIDDAIIFMYKNNFSSGNSGTLKTVETYGRDLPFTRASAAAFLQKMSEATQVVDLEGNVIHVASRQIIGLKSNASYEPDQLSKTFRSSYSNKDYVEIKAADNQHIDINGHTSFDKSEYAFIIEDKSGAKAIKVFNPVQPDGSFTGNISIDNILPSGDYIIRIYFKSDNESVYSSNYFGFPLRLQQGELSFPKAPVYSSNHDAFVANSYVDPSRYLSLNDMEETKKDELTKLAKSITQEGTTDYEKLLEIHDWITENIYYDWDMYKSGVIKNTDAYDTYMNKKSVCQGYAELTDALLRCVGIPSRVVLGYVLHRDKENWDQVDDSVSNHAWDEACIDGRWVILDTTLDSGNGYENGQFTKSAKNYNYFDPTLEAFSLDHKINGGPGSEITVT